VSEKMKLLIVGGSAAGPTAASAARRKNPQAQVVMLEQGEFISYGA